MEFKKYLIIEELDSLVEGPAIQGINISPEHPSSKYIDPKTGKPWKRFDKIEQLRLISEKLVKSGKDENDLWVQFSNVAKLGVNPKSKFQGTPLGVYAYPLPYVIDREGSVPFFGERKYMLVFEVSKDESIFKINKESKPLSDVISHFRASTISQLSRLIPGYIDESKTHIKSLISKIRDEDAKSSIEKIWEPLLKEIIYDIKSRIEDEERLSSSKNLKKKISDIISSKSRDAIIDRQQEYDKIEGFISDISYIIYVDKKYSQEGAVYEDVNLRDFSAEVSSKFLKFLSEHGFDEGKFPNKKIHSWEEIIEMLSYGYKDKNFDISINYSNWAYDSIIDTQSKLSSFNSSKVHNKISFAKKRLLRIFENDLMKKIDDFSEQTQEKIKDFDFPFKEELIKYAREKDLSLPDLLSRTASSLSLRSSNAAEAFIYRFTESIARQLYDREVEKMEKDGRSPSKQLLGSLWTKVLRDIGVKGLSDAEGTASIHSAEPFQGVFFDARKYKLLALVDNNSTTDDAWHLPKYERKTRKKTQQIFSRDQTNLERWTTGINNALEQLIGNPVYFHDLSPRTYKKHMEMLSKFVKLVKSYLREKNKNPELKDYEVVEKIEKSIGVVLIIFKRNTQLIKASNPSIIASEKQSKEQLLDTYNKVLSSMRVLGYNPTGETNEIKPATPLEKVRINYGPRNL
jgi:hypothetical protein